MRSCATLLLIASAPIAAAQTISIDIHFESALWELGPQQTTRIDSLVDGIGLTHISHITLEGHTDSVGSFDFNQRLAGQRVASVKQALMDKAIPYSLITTSLIVTDRPIADNSTEHGRALNRRVRMEIRTDPAHEVGIWNEISQHCLKDTVIVIDERLRFRAKKCQALYCLRSFEDLSFADFIASDLSTVSLSGQVHVMCGIYRSSLWDACDTLLVFDPPLRVEATVPKGITATAARDLFGTFSNEGRWIDPSGDKIRVQVKREGDRTIAVFNVHRLAPAFSICCGGQPRVKHLKLRLKLKGVPRPTRVRLYGQDPLYAMEMEYKRGILWLADRLCDPGSVFRIEYGDRADSTWKWVSLPLNALRHRTWFIGRKCPRMVGDEQEGNRPRRPFMRGPRTMHRTYLVRQRDLDEAGWMPE